MNKIKEFPLVSIVAVCHKHPAYVIEALESVTSQTYSNIELIIINNLKDECESIIQNWINKFNVKCKFIQNEEPKNITQNCNLGLANCDGKYLQVISCDDILLPQKIQMQVNVFEDLRNDYACVYSDMLYINEKGLQISEETLQEKKRKKWGTLLFPSGNLKNELSLLSFIPAPSALLRTDTIKKIEGYDEKYIFEDWPMWIKLCKNNYQFEAIDQALVKYRILPASFGKSSKNTPYAQSLIEFYSDNFSFFDFRNKNTFSNFILALSNSSFKLNNLFLAIKALLKSGEIANTRYLFTYIFR